MTAHRSFAVLIYTFFFIFGSAELRNLQFRWNLIDPRFPGLLTKYGANPISADNDGDGIDEIIVSPEPDPKAEAKIKVFKRN
jgi:hypothetical protein